MRQDVVKPPTPVELRMRIAETGIRQHLVAARLGVSQGHLSNVLRERPGRKVRPEFLIAVGEAIEQVAAESVA